MSATILSAQPSCGTEDSNWQRNAAITIDHRNQVLTIPIVFHLIRQPDEKPISKEQLLSQIDALNRDFNLEHNELYKVPKSFWPYIKSASIEFCLASELGDNGVTTTISDNSNIGQEIFTDGRRSVCYSVLGGRDAIEPEHVLNIWVASMSSFSGTATFPDHPKPAEDGIVIDPDFLGNTAGQNQYFLEGRTLVHEVGHYLGLRHPWIEEGCGTDDGIQDTPMQDGPYFRCPNPHETISCGSLDMSQNYMQFNDDPCLLYFTQDQVALMRSVLLNERAGITENADRFCGSIVKSDTKKQIFYNPLKQHLQVYGVDPSERTTIEVWSMNGQLVRKVDLRGQYIPELGLEHLPSGIYMARLSAGSIHQTLKFLKS